MTMDDVRVDASGAVAEQEAARREARFSGSARWQQILRTAEELFAREGYKAASMRKIADAAGMIKGSIYHYIENKEDLLYHVLLDIHSERFEEAIPQDLPGVDRVQQYIERLIRRHIERIAIGPLLQIDIIQALSPERQETVLARRRAYDDTLRNLIAQGKQDGSIRADLDETMTTLAILSSTSSIYRWYDPERGSNVDRIVKGFCDLYITGMRTQPAPVTRPSTVATT
jgi:TetR/AcrR family transcriptional regulator, cholesterol catabolism regulator